MESGWRISNKMKRTKLILTTLVFFIVINLILGVCAATTTPAKTTTGSKTQQNTNESTNVFTKIGEGISQVVGGVKSTVKEASKDDRQKLIDDLVILGKEITTLENELDISSAEEETGDTETPPPVETPPKKPPIVNPPPKTPPTGNVPGCDVLSVETALDKAPLGTVKAKAAELKSKCSKDPRYEIKAKTSTGENYSPRELIEINEK
jgi:hypothetical protein